MYPFSYINLFMYSIVLKRRQILYFYKSLVRVVLVLTFRGHLQAQQVRACFVHIILFCAR